MKYHLNYFDKWGTEAANWVVARARNASGAATAGGGQSQTSGAHRASDALKKGIMHPIANVFMLLIALFVL